VIAFRRRAGYSEEEVMGFREMFSGYDRDRGGTLDTMELSSLLADLGRQPKTKKDQEIFTRTLKDALHDHYSSLGEEVPVDTNHASVTFDVFLHFMRRFSDLREAELKEKEQRLLGGLTPKFEAQEIVEWRQIFDSFDPDGMGEIGYGEVKHLLKALQIYLKEAESEELKVLVDKADDDRSGRLDFQEFLLLMRWMLNDNFAKMSDKMNEAKAPAPQEDKKDKLRSAVKMKATTDALKA